MTPQRVAKHMLAGAMIVACLVAAGCAKAKSTTGATEQKKIKTVAFATVTQQGQIFVQQAQILVEYGKKLGIDVLVYDNNGNAETMISNANLMVAKKPDAIIEFPAVADATARVAATFKASGIPCLSVNVGVEGCPLFNFNQKYLAEKQAIHFADQMKARGWDGTNTTVVIEQYSALGPSVNVAVTWFYQELAKRVPNMTQVSSDSITATTTTIVADQGVQVDAGLTVDSSYKAFSQALQTIPAGRHLVVYTVNDDDTVGTYRALVNAHREKDSMLAGYGGDEDALKALRTNPSWVSDSQGFFANWGEFILAELVAMVEQGTTPPAETYPPMVVLSKDNISTYYDDNNVLKKMPALPDESQYLLETGVLQKIGDVEGAS